jgi:hypothetical protein
MAPNSTYDVIIVGSGPGGYAAVFPAKPCWTQANISSWPKTSLAITASKPAASVLILQ